MPLITNINDNITTRIFLGISNGIILTAEIRKELNDINVILNGQPILASKEFETEEGLNARFSNSYYSTFDALNAPTETHMELARDVDSKLSSLNNRLEQLKQKYYQFINSQKTTSGFPEMPLLW